MDPSLVAISAHSFERIIAVLLGGLGIYYGFRLFLVVPFETRSDGKIQLPGVSVVMAKAGPGLFFAAFGAIVVITSLMRPIKVGADGSYQGVTEAVMPKTEEQHSGLQANTAISEQDLARVRLAIQTLNCMQRSSAVGSKTLPAQDGDHAVRDAKLALMQTVWSSSTFGDFETFKLWAVGRRPSTSSPAKAIFEAERSDCPLKE
jgi:hypothetical protein